MQYFFKGLKNLEAARRQKGLLPSKEGKSKMSVLLFRHLADYFHAKGDVVAVFNHSWSWNLMCRSFNVAQLHAPALGWAGDCISVQYGQSKTNKGGGKRNKTAMMKHLFVNPFEPMVCHLVMLTAMHIAVAHTPLSLCRFCLCRLLCRFCLCRLLCRFRLRRLLCRCTDLPDNLSGTTDLSSSYYRSKSRRETVAQGLFQKDIVHVIQRHESAH